MLYNSTTLLLVMNAVKSHNNAINGILKIGLFKMWAYITEALVE